MKKSDLYCGCFLAGLGVFVVVHALRTIDLGNPQSPGAGFFPFIVGLVMIFLSGLIVFLAFRDKIATADYNEWPTFHGNVFWSLGLLLAYAIFLLEFLGFILSGFLLLLLFYKASSGKKWWVSATYAAVIICTTYYFFGVLLDAQFPQGFWTHG